MSQVHDLKCWGGYFECLLDGRKPFEVRREDDRHFDVGDELLLREFIPAEFPDADGRYTGRALRKKVTYILRGAPFMPDGIVVMGLARETIVYESWPEKSKPLVQ